MISPQLRQQSLRRRPKLIAGAAQGHGGARLEHVAQLGEEDALLSPLSAASAIAARRARWGVRTNDGVDRYEQVKHKHRVKAETSFVNLKLIENLPRHCYSIHYKRAGIPADLTTLTADLS